MEEKPIHLCILVQAGRWPREAEILDALSGRGYLVRVLRTVPDLAAAVEAAACGPVVVVVDMASTLHAPTDISGYRAFLRDYGTIRRKATCDLRLLVVTCVGPSEFVGYPGLVQAYLAPPVDTERVLAVVDRLAGSATR